MKRIFTFMLMLVALAVSCNKYDDTQLINKVENLDKRVTTLEELQKAVNEEVASLENIINALDEKDYVTSVEPISDGSGYVINFKKNSPVTIKHGNNGNNGEDGNISVISVKKESNGIYYWTVDGEWLLNEESQKIPLTGDKGDDGEKGDKGENGNDGITPKLQINSTTNQWEISLDNGITWTSTGVNATGDKGSMGDKGETGAQGDAIFKKNGIDNTNPNYVVLTLADGTTITLPKANLITVGFSKYEGVEITALNSKLDIVLPATFKENNYTAILAEVVSKSGDAKDIITRSGETNWAVEINKPTFDAAGNYNNDAWVKITPPTGTVDGTEAVLTVSVVCSNGEKVSSSVAFTFVIPQPKIYAIGDFYPNNENPIGLVYKIANGGLNGMILSLDRAEGAEGYGIIWMASIGEIGANSTSGLENMRTIMAQANYSATNYPAFAWVAQKNIDAGIDTKGYADGTKGVWFFPAQDELGVIFTLLRDIYERENNDTDINKILTDAGYTAMFYADDYGKSWNGSMVNFSCYLSSQESPYQDEYSGPIYNSQSWNIRKGNPMDWKVQSSTLTAKGDNRFVRAVMSF